MPRIDCGRMEFPMSTLFSNVKLFSNVRSAREDGTRMARGWQRLGAEKEEEEDQKKK